MILQKIKEYHKILDSLDEDQLDSLEIQNEVDSSIIQSAIRHGKWNVLFYEADENSTASYGLRVFPALVGDNWPVVYTMPYMETVIEYPNMTSKIVGDKLNVCIQDRDACETYSSRWERLNESLNPICNIFGGKDYIKLLKDVVINSSNWPESDIDDEEIEVKLKQLFLNLDKSKEAKQLIEIIEKIKLNKAELPAYENSSLDIYSDRIKSILSQNAYALAFKKDFKLIEDSLFYACLYCHGFDSERAKPSYMLSGKETSLVVFDPIKYLLGTNAPKISDKIRSQPEFRIAEAMNKKRNSYNGVEHLEVAAYYDEKGEPLKSWNNLVSAGYWAGKNLPDAQPEILNAAIQLCQRQGWKEAEEVLNYNKGILES